MTKKRTVIEESLSLETLVAAQPDAVADFDHDLGLAIKDLAARPNITAKRVVKLEIELTLDDKNRTTVYNVIKTSVKVPARVSEQKTMNLTAKGQLLFDYDDVKGSKPDTAVGAKADDIAA